MNDKIINVSSGKYSRIVSASNRRSLTHVGAVAVVIARIITENIPHGVSVSRAQIGPILTINNDYLDQMSNTKIHSLLYCFEIMAKLERWTLI